MLESYGYFHIKLLDTGDIISVVESSTNHSFFSAAIDYVKEVAWVFGSAHNRETRDAPCDVGSRVNCSLGVWWSTDLVNWNKGPPLFFGQFRGW